MTYRLAAQLELGGLFTTRSFELRDLAASLHALEPEQVVFCFWQSTDGASTLYLNCSFSDESAERCQRLKEVLLRADIAGRFECVFIDAEAGPPAVTALSIGVPDDACLPSGQWFALPVSLRDAAIDVLQHAQANGYAVGYRVELAARRADAGLARRLVPALAAIATRKRQPEIEAALQEAIECASSDGWSARESFLLPVDGTAGTWLDKLVLRRLKTTMAFLPADFWTVGRDAPVVPASPAAAIQRARTVDFPDQLLEAVAPSRNDKVLAVPQRSALPVSDGDYVFVSYAHANRDYGEQVIARLRDAGVRVWFDAGIQPGTVWDEELESRIRCAGAVVVCLTAHYEQSRYCTRELKFADLLAKPILPVAPTPWVWGSGLQLMFQELQVASFDQGRGFVALRDALRMAAPQVFA